MTPQPYYTTVLSNGMLAVPLPEELRGKSVKIIVEQEPVPKTGILSIAGILKDYQGDDIHDERYEYLMEKYSYGKNTD